MVSRWVHLIASFGFIILSLKYGIPPEATAATALADNTTWAYHIDYLKVAWPGWLGAGIGLLWFGIGVLPRQEKKVIKNPDSKSSRRLNRPDR